MPIKEFELFHGAVLTRLARAEQPLSLCMIETKPGEAWSTYRINDAVSLLVKHSLTSQLRKKEEARVWQFVFTPDQMRQLATPSTWAALVCGARSVDDDEMEVCLLEPEELAELLDIQSGTQQSLSVKRLEGKGLRVSSKRVAEIIVSRSRLEKWEVPGR